MNQDNPILRCPLCQVAPVFEYQSGLWQGGCPDCRDLFQVIKQPSLSEAFAQWNHVVVPMSEFLKSHYNEAK